MRGMTYKSTGRILILALAFAPMAAWADEPIGQVKTETGAVTLERQVKTQPIAIGDHVFQSDIIATAAGATVGITFADNSTMSLGPESRLALDQFRFDTTTHDGVFDSSLQKGTLAVRSGQIVRQTPEAMHIRTPSALLGVRGTEFVVRADGKS
jgi:hypothetical protein